MKHVFKNIIVFILTLEARLVLLKYRPRIIAITGTVGKTAAKDAIHTALRDAFFVRASEKSFNSDIGVPLTILGRDNAWYNPLKWLGIFAEGLALIFLKNHYPKVLVLEVGTDRPGDIGRIASWLRPDTVVVTAFAEVPVHVEFFESRDALIREKTLLASAVKKGGTLVLNGDDPDVAALKREEGRAVVFFGTQENAHIRASHSEILYAPDDSPSGISARVHYKNNLFPLVIKGTIGAHFVYAILAALAVGITEERNILSLLESLQAFEVPPGRGKLLSGARGAILIDDSYNASPKAVLAALDALQAVKIKGRKIAVLGDMLELGKYTADEHRKVGARAAEVSDIVVSVGARAELISEEARSRGKTKENTFHFGDAKSAGVFLKDMIQEGDIVLVKGSQSMRMERVVSTLLKNPEDKKFLARQEPEWMGK